jgi:hypothetical protein
MKIIIAGGRDFRNYALLKERCDDILFRYFLTERELEFVSGGQVSIDPITKEKYGADYYGEVYAKECGFNVRRFPADWDKYRAYAGPKRNKEMAKYVGLGGILIAFHDGESRGTANMIKEAKAENLIVHIVKY